MYSTRVGLLLARPVSLVLFLLSEEINVVHREKNLSSFPLSRTEYAVEFFTYVSDIRNE